MGFVCRRGTAAKVEIPDGTFKEAHLLFTHDIMSKVDKYNIQDSLIINIDQTLTKYVSVKGSSDKRSITANSSIPNDFLLSVNETHYSNEKEAYKLIEEIVVPYIEKVCQEENLPVSQKALVIMDVFCGQITSVFLDCFRGNKIEVVCIPANMTNLLQHIRKGLPRGESPHPPKSTCYYGCLFWPNNTSCFRLLQR